MYETIRRNLAKRSEAEPWSLETSAMYALGEESVAEHAHRYAVAVAEGRVPIPGFCSTISRRPRSTSTTTTSCGPRSPRCTGRRPTWMDVERLVAEARDPQTREADFRRFFLNQAGCPLGRLDRLRPSGRPAPILAIAWRRRDQGRARLRRLLSARLDGARRGDG